MSDSNNYHCNILLQLFQHYLRRETGETSVPYFHQLTALRVVIPMKSLLVQRQSPVSHSYTVNVFSSKIADTVKIWHLTPQNTSELRKILSTRHISRAYKWKGKTLLTGHKRLSRMVGSSEVALSPLNLSSGLISHLHLDPHCTHYGRVILNCVCVVDRFPRTKSKVHPKKFTRIAKLKNMAFWPKLPNLMLVTFSCCMI